MILSWCTSNQKLKELEKENTSLREKLWEITSTTSWNLNKPNIVTITLSRLGWALSRQTSAIWEQKFFTDNQIYNWYESLPINSEEVAKEFVSYRFNGWGYALIASCNDWYAMTKCEPFSETDSIENQWTQCFLWNEDPNLMRTSMIIECSKM